MSSGLLQKLRLPVVLQYWSVSGLKRQYSYLEFQNWVENGGNIEQKWIHSNLFRCDIGNTKLNKPDTVPVWSGRESSINVNYVAETAEYQDSFSDRLYRDNTSYILVQALLQRNPQIKNWVSEKLSSQNMHSYIHRLFLSIQSFNTQQYVHINIQECVDVLLSPSSLSLRNEHRESKMNGQILLP